MKKIGISICAIMVTVLLMAQPSLAILPDSTLASFETQLLDEYEEFTTLTRLVNTSAGTINLRWSLEQLPENDCPDAWKFRVSDNNQGYPYGTTSNVIFGSVPNSPIVMSPQDTSFIELYVLPKMTYGCCTLKIRYGHMNDMGKEIILDSSFTQVCIFDSTLSSVSMAQLPKMISYPNPTSGQFRILGEYEGNGVQVFNSMGQLVLNTSYRKGQSYDLSMLTDGLYHVCLVGNENGIPYRATLIKQAETP